MSTSAAHGGPFPRVTAPMLQAMKASQRPIVMVTAYDTPSARLVDAAGVDAILVGDSLGMTVLGYDSTLPVTMDDMVGATAAVARGATPLVVADMPFMSYQASAEEALRNAGRLARRGRRAGRQARGRRGGRRSTVAPHRRGGHPGDGTRRPHAAVGPRAGRLPVQAKEAASAARCSTTAARSRTPARSRSCSSASPPSSPRW